MGVKPKPYMILLRLHILTRLAPVAVFPRLAPVSGFPALGTGFRFSRAWHRFQVFPRLAPVSGFLVLGISGLPAPSICFMLFASTSDWFIALSPSVVIGQILLFWFWFYDSPNEPAGSGCSKVDSAIHLLNNQVL